MLLRKAESTTPQEAKLLVAKAQELMTKYAIEQAMLDEVRGQTDDVIEQTTLVYVGILRHALADIGWALVRANSCKGVYWEWQQHTDEDGRNWKEAYHLEVTGFRSDLERLRLMDASLQVQSASALAEWWENFPERGQISRHEAWRQRKSFLTGFAYEIGTRLAEANAKAEAEVAMEHAAATHVSEEEATESVALVVRSRKDQVQDWFDKKYGDLLGGRSRRSTSRSSGFNAGRKAGARADLGSGKLRSRGKLGPG